MYKLIIKTITQTNNDRNTCHLSSNAKKVSLSDVQSWMIVANDSRKIQNASSFNQLQSWCLVARTDVVVNEQFNKWKGKVGLRVCGNFPYLLQQFLNRVVSFRYFVVFWMKYCQVETKITVLVHLLKVGLTAFLHIRGTKLKKSGINIVNWPQKLVKKVICIVKTVQLTISLKFIGQNVVVSFVSTLRLKFVLLLWGLVKCSIIDGLLPFLLA